MPPPLLLLIFCKEKNMNGLKSFFHNVKSVVLTSVAIVLVVVMIVANCILNYYSLIINRFLVGDTADASGSGTQDSLAAADLLVRNSAEDSMVLLKNENGYLPKPDLKKVNLFGWGSTDYGFLLTGGGSGGTSITDTLSNGNARIKLDLTDAFTEAGIEFNTTLNAAYENFSKFDADYRSKGSTGANVIQSLLNPDASFYTDDLLSNALSYSKTAVAVISRWGAENGGDGELKNIGAYKNGTFLELTENERAI